MNSAAAAKALRLARSEDKKRVAKISLDHAKGDERERFFGGHNAAGDDDGPAFAAFAFLGEPGGERRRRREDSISYFRLPLTFTRSAGAPRARMRSASVSVCIRKAAAFRSAEARNGRR